MATGASTADLAVVVVDATRRPAGADPAPHCIAALLGVRHLLVAANKMDLVGLGRGGLPIRQWKSPTPWPAASASTRVTIVPVSALLGDNVVEPSTHTPWYTGPTLLAALEDAPAGAWAHDGGSRARLPVQWVVRHPGGGRSYAGMVSGGTFRPGDEIVVLPGGQRSRLTSVETFDGPLDEAPASLSVTVRLDDDLDVSRGDLIAPADGSSRGRARVRGHAVLVRRRTVRSRTALPSQAHDPAHAGPGRVGGLPPGRGVARARADRADLGPNDIGVVRFAVGTPLAVDPYRANRVTGSFVVIDEHTNATVAAGMVGAPVLAAVAQG